MLSTSQIWKHWTMEKQNLWLYMTSAPTSDCFDIMLDGVTRFMEKLYLLVRNIENRTHTHTHTHTSGRQLKITFLDILDYSE